MWADASSPEKLNDSSGGGNRLRDNFEPTPELANEQQRTRRRHELVLETKS